MKYFTTVGDVEREFSFEHRAGGLIAKCGDRTYQLDVSTFGDGSTFSLLIDGRSLDVPVDRVDGGLSVEVHGERVLVRVEDQRERAMKAVSSVRPSGKRQVRTAMPGTVVDVLVAEGDHVEEGQTLVILEAMKMRNPIPADGPGVVAGLRVTVDQTVAAGELLMDLQ